MDPPVEVEVEALAPTNNHSDGVEQITGRKREVENVENGNLGKRHRFGGADEMRRVAEIVMVLSAMRTMSGGRKPTDVEVELMAEARKKLVQMCEEVAPRDIVPMDAIGAVIEDLGLNAKLKDQRLGFRGSKLSIAEKFELSKKKMEESKKFTAPAASYAPHPPQASFGALAENRGTGTPPMVRMFSSDKSSPAPLSSGGFPASPLGHVSANITTSQPYQLHTSDMTASVVSTGQPGSHLVSKVERPQFKMDGRSSGPAYVSQMLANSTANQPLANAPTWSIQTSSTRPNNFGTENKDLNHNAVKVEGTADSSMARVAPRAASNHALGPTAQTAGNFQSMHPMQGMNVVQAPFGNNHGEIAKIVQNLLQPQLPEHLTWTPPSREYMNKALTCQMCKQTINDVDSLLLCDACERGFHLKCLQANNQKGMPRAEWHCMKCLMLSNGKPLPPKYGRVMRSVSTLNVPPNASGTQSSSEKKVEALDPKVSQQKIMVNGSSVVQSPGSGTVGSNGVDSAPNSKIKVPGEIPVTNISSTVIDVERRTLSEAFPNNPMKSWETIPASLVRASSERSESSAREESLVSETKVLASPITSDIINSNSDNPPPSHYPQVVCQTGVSGNEGLLKTNPGNKPTVDNLNDIRGHGEGATMPGNPSVSSDGLHDVEWIGNILQFMDGKTYYQSCCIDEVTYKVQDHALFCSSHEKLIPSKLQAMWEDSKTGSKWVTVNRCYLPNDLPESVGRPCPPESNEVYASNHDSSVMAGLIQGPCEVLSPAMFKEESERRNQLGIEANSGSPPVFLCKWFYDEFQGKFNPVSS